MKKYITEILTIIWILILFISFNAIGAGTKSSTDVSTDRVEQINKLYELAEKHIYNKK